ncbi:MAG: hypothetical protein U1E59_01915 [Amaricoccus sp.]
MSGALGLWLRRGVVAAMLAVPACAGQPQPADNAYCAMLFDQFDAFVFTPQAWGLTYDFRQMQLARIRQARCITFTANLANMDAVAKSLAGHRPPAGMALQAPVAVAAGVVTNPSDEARALAFFEAAGYRARSVGWEYLGTRVYVQALTLPQIDDIVGMAQRAGFVGPYPSRWVTF